MQTGCQYIGKPQNVTTEPIQGQSLRITVLAAYKAEDVWSPDSEIVKFVSPDGRVNIFVEIGESGYPNYENKPSYFSEEISIEGYDGSLITFYNPDRDSLNHTAILRFLEYNWVRAWAYAEDGERLKEALAMMRTVRWKQDD